MAIPEREDTELPLACSLPGAEQGGRIERWRALAERALVEQAATAQGVRQRYRDAPEVRAELEDLAGLERECCGWASWRVLSEEGAVVLEVSAAGEGAATLRSMFGVGGGS